MGKILVNLFFPQIKNVYYFATSKDKFADVKVLQSH